MSARNKDVSDLSHLLEPPLRFGKGMAVPGGCAGATSGSGAGGQRLQAGSGNAGTGERNLLQANILKTGQGGSCCIVKLS
jgi:hypothetical protein